MGEATAEKIRNFKMLLSVQGSFARECHEVFGVVKRLKIGHFFTAAFRFISLPILLLSQF